MAPRRVIADSDDSDDDLALDDAVQHGPDAVATEGAEVEAPAMEPLSSQWDRAASSSAAEPLDLVRPGSDGGRRASDSTDASFFNRVHDEQRRLAQQHLAEQRQANLIENIVKMSQRASESSSGDKVSFTPLRAQDKAEQASSATDITSPAARLLKARSKKAAPGQVSSASEITTPRTSNENAKDEWDVPSSPEDGHAPKSARSGRLAASGKRKRDVKGPVDHFAGAELDMVEVSRSSSDRPVKKGKRTSSPSDESVIPDTGNFYIAPSALTPSQKNQYHKIQSSGESAREEPASNAGVQPAPFKPKSSGATTVAVSTPSRYASSGPRPPWELGQSGPRQSEVVEETALGDEDTGAEGGDDVIDLTSSPDIIASGNNRRRPQGNQSAIKLPRSLSRVDEEGVQPVGNSPSRRTRKKAMADKDELGHDSDWDSDEVGFHREEYRPRKSRRREASADDDDVEYAVPLEDKDELMEAAPPAEEEDGADSENMNEPPKPSKVPKSSAVPAAENTPQPKKRGRKKKQTPATEDPAQDAPATETTSTNASGAGPADPAPASELETPGEKPKKKRGRPRKSDTAKTGAVAADAKPAEEPPLEEIPSTAPFGPSADLEPGPVPEPEEPATEPEELPAEPEEPPTEPEPARKSATPAATSTPGKAKTATSAGKPQPVYRVGLSKKSRVASLLKIKPRQ